MDTQPFRDRFKDLASRAQEAGKMIAAQVKDQQTKFVNNRSKSQGMCLSV